MSSVARRSIAGTFSFIRSAWAVAGITLLLVVLLEIAMRVRRSRSESAPPTSFMAGDPRNEPWSADYKREFEAARTLNWQSYVYFRRAPIGGREVAVDSLGHRITPQPQQPTAPVARVRMYGGSTMWGEPLRAEHTIPAEVARRLQPLAGQGARIDVTNVGETGYVFTQEVLQLMLDLRRGERPDVVVFYDGINDVASAVQRGVAGDPQNEVKRVAEFNLGRQLETSGPESPLRRDARIAATLTKLAFGRLAIVQWAQARNARPAPIYVSADSLTAIEADSFQVRVQQMHQRLPKLLDSTMRTIAPNRFVDASGLFKGDSTSVFVDRTGHNTEAAIPHIVDSFWPLVSLETSKVVSGRR